MARRFLTTAELSKIKFNQSPDAGLQQGEMIYDSEHLALMFGLSANVKMELGQSTVVLVYNDTLSSIPAGRAVYGVGVQNERPSIVQSVSSSMEQSSRTFGITAESIPAGGYGWVVTQGLLGGINTSSYLAGDELWLSSTTPGVLVTSSVGSPNYDLLLGYCVVSSATDGVIYVSFTRGVDVAGIHDIVLTDLASGDILRYNSASGYWENEPLSALGGGATVSETAPTSPSAGDFWFNSATAETFIYYDSTWVEVGEGGGSGLLEPVQGLDFDTVSPDASTTGRLVWDDGEGTLSFGLKGGNVDLQIGQENVALCYNGTGSSIPDGTVVYISGAQGQRPRISLAQANAESTASKVLGITTETIANGAEGFVATFGIVNGLDTSAFTAGQSLYLSPTVAGGLTATKPVAPNHMVFVGYAISISASSGRIFVNPQNGYELDEIHDVIITSKQNGDLIAYNSSTGLWNNTKTLSGTYSMDTLDLNEAQITASLNTINVITPVLVDSFSSTLYRGAEYTFQFSQNGTDFTITKVIMIHNGVDVAITEYGNVGIGATIPYDFNGSFSLGNLEMTITCSNANSSPLGVKFTRTLIDT